MDIDTTFDLPKSPNNIIKVIGVGGGGGNAVNHMFNQNIIATLMPKPYKIVPL